jgi:Protein of unknown function (DUF3037)
MNPAKGYYCLIQYCPDLGRLEAANVGVLLFCPERMFLDAVTSRNNRRIIQFFGREGHDWTRINSFKRGIKERLLKESSGIRTVEDLERFIALRANVLQITSPRPMKVLDTGKDLERLAEEFLGQAPQTEKKESLRKRISDQLLGAGLASKIRQDIPIEVPIRKKKIDVPFGYQNGRFNLLVPVTFTTEDPDHSFTTACKYAVEGESLYETKHPEFGQLQFCVIGQFRPKDKDTPARVGEVLEKHQVQLYRANELSKLIKHIQETGKDISASRT